MRFKKYCKNLDFIPIRLGLRFAHRERRDTAWSWCEGHSAQCPKSAPATALYRSEVNSVP
jgi:hypothetical protein